MTRPSVVKDLLIFYASVNDSPDTPVLLILSDPAKSTRYILPIFDEKSVVFFCSIYNTNTLWDLEDSLFISVAPIALFSLPILRSEKTSSSLPT